MDAFRLELGSRELQNDHLMYCVRWLRSRPAYAHAGLVYVCENLPGSRGSELAYSMRNVPSSITMSEFGSDRRPGVPKDIKITDAMVLRTRNLLNTDSLHLADDFTTYTADGVTPESMIDKLCDQFLAFQRAPIGGSSTNTHWTGKHGVSGRDDLAVAALMPAYWSQTFYDSADYAAFRKQINDAIAYVHL